MATMLTAKEVAARLETDPRTLRKFLRSPQGLDAKVGKGQRWSIEAKQVRSLKARFEKWDADRRAPEATEEEVTEVTEEN